MYQYVLKKLLYCTIMYYVLKKLCIIMFYVLIQLFSCTFCSSNIQLYRITIPSSAQIKMPMSKCILYMIRSITQIGQQYQYLQYQYLFIFLPLLSSITPTTTIGVHQIMVLKQEDSDSFIDSHVCIHIHYHYTLPLVLGHPDNFMFSMKLHFQFLTVLC